MTPKKLTEAAIYPLTELSVLFALLGFWMLLALAGMAGMFGLWLGIVLVPALFRYQVVLLEARARGQEPQPPGVEFFNWTSDLWSLFPAVLAVFVAWAAYGVYSSLGLVPMLLVLVAAGSLYPASLGVLAITHSPLQSVNPVALYRFIRHCGPSYAIAPLYILVIAGVFIAIRGLPELVRAFVEVFLIFSLHSVIGAVIEPRNIVDDVDIPDAEEPGQAVIASRVEKARADALTHAYGFVSRGNRDGGFKHIFSAIERDADPAAAWAWYFKQMLAWDDDQAALFFAQHYLRDLLAHDEAVPATKLILRCRLLDDTFKPFSEDVPAAIQAAERCGNEELVAVLKAI